MHVSGYPRFLSGNGIRCKTLDMSNEAENSMEAMALQRQHVTSFGGGWASYS